MKITPVLIYQRFGGFIAGFLTATVIGTAALCSQLGGLVDEGSRAWNRGKPCLAYDYLIVADYFGSKASAEMLGALSAGGECVHQDLSRARMFYDRAGIRSNDALAQAYFRQARDLAHSKPELANPDLRGRVTTLIKRAKDLGFKPRIQEERFVSKEFKDLVSAIYGLEQATPTAQIQVPATIEGGLRTARNE